MRSKEQLLVVVVEDDEDMRLALLGALRALELDPHGFAQPRELMDEVASLEVDCWILDIGLPGKTGFELYASLGLSSKCAPVVFITGRDEVGWRAMAKSLRGEYLLKPFTAIALRDAIKRAIGSRAASPFSPSGS